MGSRSCVFVAPPAPCTGPGPPCPLRTDSSCRVWSAGRHEIRYLSLGRIFESMRGRASLSGVRTNTHAGFHQRRIRLTDTYRRHRDGYVIGVRRPARHGHPRGSGGRVMASADRDQAVRWRGQPRPGTGRDAGPTRSSQGELTSATPVSVGVTGCLEAVRGVQRQRIGAAEQSLGFC